MYYGLSELDSKIETYLDFDGGTFFEAGANNGLNQSNTRYFEERRGWRGILVEPIPQRFFECVVNRPEAYVEWAALVPSDWGKPDADLIYCDLMTVTQGSMGGREVEHVARGSKYIPNETPFRFKARARTISEILEKYQLKRIDFMSLDLEGFELEALKGLDMRRHRPRFLLVEVRDEKSVDAFLAPFYQKIGKMSHHDVLYRAI
jgi:FkbM family methyltransferase